MPVTCRPLITASLGLDLLEIQKLTPDLKSPESSESRLAVTATTDNELQDTEPVERTGEITVDAH